MKRFNLFRILNRRQINILGKSNSSSQLVKLKRKDKVFEVVKPLWPPLPLSVYRETNLLRKLKYYSESLIDYMVREIMSRSDADRNTLIFDRRPPASVRGMKELDRNPFKKTINVPCIAVHVKGLNKLLKKIKPCLIKLPKFKSVVNLADDDPRHESYKLLMLNPDTYRTVDDMSEDLKKTLEDHGASLSSFMMSEVEIGYDNWLASEILRAILPEDLDNVCGHAIVGHIAHLNLNEESLPYKRLIGQVILDKSPSIKTVVNKLNTIDNTYRNFNMEVLAGEDNFVTKAKENGFVFEMDFSKVYWNSRLGSEHQRIVDEMKGGDVLYDLFAGVGPFSIPSAKKCVMVYANDLNPSSFESLKKNVSLNKVKSENIVCSNLDGREFVKTILKQDLMTRLNNRVVEPVKDKKSKFHIVMNLPAIAIEFLDSFQGLLCDMDKDVVLNSDLPHVYCYCFSKNEDPKPELQERVRVAMGEELPTEHSIRLVRDVAPNKLMYCIHFQLSPTVLLNQEQQEGHEPDQKRIKLGTGTF